MSAYTRQSGFVLLETMAALLLLGLCLLPLAVLLDDLSTSMRREEQQLSVVGATDMDAQSLWDWGPRAVCAEWRADGALRVEVVGGAGEKPFGVGVWTEGWFVREVAVSPGGEVVFDPGDFALAAEGSQVVIRVKGREGAWGVPWRTSVRLRTASVGTESGPTEPSMGTAGSTVVIHLPAAGTHEVRLQAGGVTRVLDAGAPADVEMPGGSVTAILSRRTQHTGAAWLPGEGRYVHLYY